jgi:hypothetical protein
LPFLRFARDKRGYETTSLVHPIRRQGRSRQRILYWFRTPPGVKVGRPALDEDAIRWIEEHNPDIEFNWQKILEAQPPTSAPPEDLRNRRGRRDKVEVRRPAPQQAQAEASPSPESEDAADSVAGPPLNGDDEGGPVVEDEPVADDLVEAIEQITHPETEERIAPPAPPPQQVIEPEQLIRLRARYAELQARITERGGDAQRIEALRAESESLNPDAWVTEAEVRDGLAVFELKIRELRAALGLRKRRRSRRGGRRRHSAQPEPGPVTNSGEG